MTTTVIGFLAIGLATSVHCAGMCGPLACGVGSMAKTEESRLASVTLYHVSRLASYTLIGTICGAIGREPLSWFFDSPAVILPWLLVAALLIVASGLDKKIPRPAFLTRITAKARFKSLRLPAPAGASVMGLVTPLLPCGPLYAVFIALMASGSAVRGAESALAFGLGTLPLLWLAQSRFQSLRRRLTPLRLAQLQRGLALVTALILAWRLHDTIPFPVEPAEAEAKSELPSCCH